MIYSFQIDTQHRSAVTMDRFSKPFDEAWIGPDQIKPSNTIHNLRSFSGIQGFDPSGYDPGFVDASTRLFRLNHIYKQKLNIC